MWLLLPFFPLFMIEAAINSIVEGFQNATHKVLDFMGIDADYRRLFGW